KNPVRRRRFNMAKVSPRILGISVVFLFVLAAVASGQEAKAAKAKEPAKEAAKAPIIWAASDLKWISPPNAPPEVKMAVLWGDPEKGPHGALHKFPPGFSAALHTHSSDLHAVVVSGTLIHGTESGAEKRLPPGSYLFEPSTYKHITACDKASECILFVE